MKILVVSHHLPPKYRSGAELYALRQSLWLLNKGHTVKAVAVEDIEAEVAQLTVRTEDYQGLEVNRLYFNRFSYPNQLKISHYNPDITAWFENYLREFKPELLLVNACYLLGVGILDAARRCGVPVVLTLHDFWFLCQRITLMRPDGSLCDGKVSAADCALCLKKDERRFLWADKLSGGSAGKLMVTGAKAEITIFEQLLGGETKLKTLAERRQRLMAALQGVEVVIAPSRYLQQVFEENGFPKDKIYYCRYGLNTEQLVKIVQKRQEQLVALPRPKASSVLQVGYLGQILPHKGVDIVVKAIRQLAENDINLTIYGAMGRDTNYDAHLRHLAGNDRRIRFAGAYNAEELASILLQLDVVVVPSIWLENSPLVIMEAQAAGLPVITTRLGGMAEMVQHEQNGLLFARKDANELAQHLRRLLNEPTLLERLKAGIKPVKSLDEEFAELLPLYEKLAYTRQSQHLPL